MFIHIRLLPEIASIALYAISNTMGVIHTSFFIDNYMFAHYNVGKIPMIYFIKGVEGGGRTKSLALAFQKFLTQPRSY